MTEAIISPLVQPLESPRQWSMINIINFIQAMDEVVPGFAAAETLLYSPELKFYSNRVKMDEKFWTACSL